MKNVARKYVISNPSVMKEETSWLTQCAFAVACIRAGRNFIGIEKDQKYFEMADARLKTEKEKQHA